MYKLSCRRRWFFVYIYLFFLKKKVKNLNSAIEPTMFGCFLLLLIYIKRKPAHTGRLTIKEKTRNKSATLRLLNWPGILDGCSEEVLVLVSDYKYPEKRLSVC